MGKTMTPKTDYDYAPLEQMYNDELGTIINLAIVFVLIIAAGLLFYLVG